MRMQIEAWSAQFERLLGALEVVEAWVERLVQRGAASLEACQRAWQTRRRA